MSTNTYEWKTLIESDNFHSAKKKKIKSLSKDLVKDHPLKNVRVIDKTSKYISNGGKTPVSTPASILEPLSLALDGLDPLTEFAQQEMDPLSKMAAEVDSVDNFNKDNDSSKKVTMQPWSVKKLEILSKYTTSEKITITTSFLSDGEKVLVKSQSIPVDKVQHRLEQLDFFEEGSQKKFDLSQSEYVGRIEQLHRELVVAWNSEQRVKALKIAIQCSKLLADTDVLSFYPSKFVLVTDILDKFGELVYDRLKSKAEYKPGSKTPTTLPEDFTQDMVPDSAKETCLNWFYKIASIRELVPRLYVEIALLRSYNFISKTELPDALLRLTDMIHGIGNPLVAAYARCYICRIGLNVTDRKSNSAYLLNNFTGFLDTYSHLFSRSMKMELLNQNMPASAYVTLYMPALNFILEAIACKENEKVCNDLFLKSMEVKNSSLVLNTIMAGFKPSYISERSLQFLELISNCDYDGISLSLLLNTFGSCITVSPPPSEQRKQTLTIAWRHISSLKSPEDYIKCVEIWISFVVQNFSTREINMVFGDIIEHLTPNRAYEKLYNYLKLIIQKVLTRIQDFEILLIMDNFLRVIDLFEQESIRVDVCKSVLTLPSNEHKINDPIISNALMFLCRTLHDSVNALTPHDEYRQIGEILCNIVSKVNYGQDFEQQLSFYVEARSSFSNIDLVLAQLVQCVNSLSVSTRQIIKGMHTRKTGDFVRACAAYCYITIPSIVSVRTQLQLYLLSGRVALYNQCLGQADACFKAALRIIPEIENDDKSELFLLSYIKQFLSTLIIVPDNPEKGVLSLTRILLNVVRIYEWNPQNGTLISIYISVLDMLCAMAQDEYPYHIEKVESNDSLYGSDPKFILEINNICSIIIKEILGQLKSLGTCRRQSQLANELFIRIVTRGDLTCPSLIQLATSLWQLSSRSGYMDDKYMAKTRDYFLQTSISKSNNNLKTLVENLEI